jgi:Ca2+-binding RTX toxin-like protein
MRRRLCLLATLTLVAAVVNFVPATAAPRPKCFGRRATLVGTKGTNQIKGTKRADVIVARAGNDVINGRGGKDLICAGAGDDVVTGGDGADRLNGGEDTDTLLGGGGNDFISGGGGIADSVDYFNGAVGPVEVNLPAGVASGRGHDELEAVENVSGSPFDDALYGNELANILLGFDGDDTILGNLGPDFIIPDEGDDTINGGGDPDTVDYRFSDPDGPITVDLFGAVGTATGQGTDSLESIEAAGGGEHDDTMVGDTNQNGFFGFGGNDNLQGAVGDNDVLQGGMGDDALDGGSGNGDTTDYLAIPEGAVAVQVDLSAGTATGQGSDSLTGFEKVNGSDANDTITGDDAGNTLFGWAGDDTLSGLAGDDFIAGGDGTDSLDGGDGSDDCLSAETSVNCEFTRVAALRKLIRLVHWAAPARLTINGIFVSAYSLRR